MLTFKLEVTHGQEQRHVDADSFQFYDGWLIFFRKPPTGGSIEYWRIRIDFVVAIETVKANSK